MLALLATLPWLLLAMSLLFLPRRRPRLQDYPPAAPGAGAEDADGQATGEPVTPRVSVIVPTRDDAHRVGACLATLLDSEYRDYEVVVVDAGSADGTLEIVDALRRVSPDRVRVLRLGGDSPGSGAGETGWQARGGWRAAACRVGAAEARGELLLFTEAGTVHDGELLGRAVAALDREGADLLTVQPRLTMHGFWERLIMPHVRLVLRARFPSARLVNRSRSPRNAVAHHEYLLFRRGVYHAIGGHEGLGPGDVEDLALAQAVVAHGGRLYLVHGDRYLETRLYRGLSDFADGWVAAVSPAARTTVVPWAAWLAPWVVAVAPVALFVLPPAALAMALLVGDAPGVVRWGFWSSVFSLVFWLGIYAAHRIRPAYAVAYPLGALAAAVLFVRSNLRGPGDRDGGTEG